MQENNVVTEENYYVGTQNPHRLAAGGEMVVWVFISFFFAQLHSVADCTVFAPKAHVTKLDPHFMSSSSMSVDPKTT